VLALAQMPWRNTTEAQTTWGSSNDPIEGKSNKPKLGSIFTDKTEKIKMKGMIIPFF